MPAIGVDLGSIRTRAAVVDDGTILGEAALNTPRGGDRLAIVDVLEAAVRAAIDAAGTDGADIGVVGVASPGAVLDETIGGAPNMPGWSERFALKEMVSQRLGRPVLVVNDATATGVAEHRHGAGVGATDMFFAHSGTGVGGGLIIGGEPFQGTKGGAGEFGHMVVVQGGATCTCGRQGCIEAYAGRRAISMAAERAQQAGRATVLFDLAHEMGRGQVTSDVFKAALDADDELVHELTAAGIQALGCGIASVVNLLDVELVVIGGGLADHLGDWYLHRIEAAMRPHLFLLPSHVRVAGATMGAMAGAVGAAQLAANTHGG